MKKAVTIAAMSAMAVSTIAAVNPHQAEAATTTESLVIKAEQNKVILTRAISADYQANAVKQPWTEYNKAKNDYNAAKAAVSKLSKKADRDRLNARLDAVKVWIDRTVIYIDAISSGKTLAGYQAALKKSMAAGDIEGMSTAYNKLSYEIKKQAAYLYKVYGQSTRQKILDTYKKPAEAAKQTALYPVSIYVEIDRLAAALKAGNDANAEKSANLIDGWFEKVEEGPVFDALVEYYMDTVSPYFNGEISTIKPYDDVNFTTNDPYITAFDAFGFYNEDGEEIYADAFEAGYFVKDEKGYFDEEGYLTAAYEENGLTQTGTDKIQIMKRDTNEVVAEITITIVKGE